jgi:hypothetical protein
MVCYRESFTFTSFLNHTSQTVKQYDDDDDDDDDQHHATLNFSSNIKLICNEKYSLGEGQLCWDSCIHLQFSHFQITIHDHSFFHMGKMYPQCLPQVCNFHRGELEN